MAGEFQPQPEAGKALLVESILDKLLTYILSVSKHVLQWSKHRETEYLNKLGLSCAKLSQA